jgi:hypothetical protein
MKSGWEEQPVAVEVLRIAAGRSHNVLERVTTGACNVFTLSRIGPPEMVTSGCTSICV